MLSSSEYRGMPNVELTTKGLKLFRDADGIHWLHLGPNTAFLVENLTNAAITREQVRLWLASQVPLRDSR